MRVRSRVRTVYETSNLCISVYKIVYDGTNVGRDIWVPKTTPRRIEGTEYFGVYYGLEVNLGSSRVRPYRNSLLSQVGVRGH